MRRIVALVGFLVSIQVVSGQGTAASSPKPMIYQKSDCAPVTQRMIEQHYSVERQSEIQDSPEDLACLNYICSASYEFAAGQAVLRSQRVLFDIQKYQQLRHPTLRITVYDEVLGLNVTLYSWNEVEAALAAIRQTYRLASDTQQEVPANTGQ
jgi:hypothetical protein